MAPAPIHHRDLRRIVLAGLAVAVLMISGVLGVVFFAAGVIDRLEVAKEQALVQRRLDRTLDGLITDLNSATVWNESVAATVGTPDMAWLQLNFGDYFSDYMDHAATLVFASDGQLIQASRDSEPVSAESEDALIQATAPLVSKIRALSQQPAKRTGVGFDAVVNQTAIVRVGSEIYLVGASTIVPEDKQIARPEGDAIVVSVRTLTSFIDGLPADLMINTPRLIETAKRTPAQITISGSGGAVLGHVTWVPDYPGRTLLEEAAPMLSLLLLLLMVAGSVLLLGVSRVSRRLLDNQAALADARDRAEAANVAKTRFLSNMSHELRTPLNGVLGMAEVLDAGELSPIQRSHLAVLKASGGDLLRLIEQVLEVSRLDKGQLKLNNAPFQLSRVVDRVFSVHAEKAGLKGLGLYSDIRVRDARMGDEDRLAQVLDALIDNAVTYTEKGRILIEAAEHADGVHIRVIDTGPGISDEALPQLFDRFVQADDSSTRRFDGAGLGLAICRELMQAMGGEVRVESSSEGSVFTLVLPLPRAQAEPKAIAA